MGQQDQMNGVDVKRFFQTVENVEREPRLGQFCFRNRNRWINGAHNRSIIHSFYGAGEEQAGRGATFVLDSDQPGLMLGTDQGANPIEYLLHGLAACLTTTIVYLAAGKGIRIEGIESHVDGDLDLRGFLGIDPNVRSGFERIRVSLIIQSDATEQELAELIELAEKRSPAVDTFTHGVNVAVEFEQQGMGTRGGANSSCRSFMESESGEDFVKI